MAKLTIESPARFVDCLACAGGHALARKGAIWMRGAGDSLSISDGETGELLAVVYFVPQGESRELCLAIQPAAARHMLAIIRFAQSTLREFAKNGIRVHARIAIGGKAGRRLALMTGFHEVHPNLFVYGEK